MITETPRRTPINDFEPIIGLEIHAQLLTRSKMFCACRADYQTSPPNTLVCPVCLAMPGSLPVINREAVRMTIITGLALNCAITPSTKFDRKNYPYPDLMKGYQISQFESPIAQNGWLDLELDGQTRRVGITRVHLEEDVAKLLHRSANSGETYSLLDVNRSGVPLMEIVGEPDIRSREEAYLYLNKVRTILQYLGVSTGNMEEGSFRCDANVSIRPLGSSKLFPKVEIKNMNSFHAVTHALDYEIARQSQIVCEGGRIIQETRGWVDNKGVTASQRSKEYAHDYRYFSEPDLPPLRLSTEWIQEIQSQIPEMPDTRRARFVSNLGLPSYDATLLTSSKATADFFEQCLDLKSLDTTGVYDRAKILSNWILGTISYLLNTHGIDLSQAKLEPRQLVELIDLIEEGTLSTTLAKTVLEETFITGLDPHQVVRQNNYKQITDTGVVAQEVETIIEEHPHAVADYLNGKDAAAKFLVGQVMKSTKGKANPSVVNDLVYKKLKDRKTIS